MAKQYGEISEALQAFISTQKIFFVGTATTGSRVNVSPKGMDSFRILSSKRVVCLNLTGSGNETSTHVQQDPRMTIMFCAFEGDPIILRLYGNARVIHPADSDWYNLMLHFPPLPGSRQIFDLAIDMVQTSCGMAVPLMDLVGERTLLNDWAEKKGRAGIQQYWVDKNQLSIDNIPSNIIKKNVKS